MRGDTTPSPSELRLKLTLRGELARRVLTLLYQERVLDPHQSATALVRRLVRKGLKAETGT